MLFFTELVKTLLLIFGDIFTHVEDSYINTCWCISTILRNKRYKSSIYCGKELLL